MTIALAAMVVLIACRHVPEKSAELWLGGDVNLGDGGKSQLQDIAGIVQGAAGIVNLEGPVAAQLPQDRLRLWNSESALVELAAVGVRVAGIANNHAADAGTDGLEQTATRLRRHGMVPAGGSSGAAFFNVNGISIAVTAHDLTHGVPGNLEGELTAARKRSAVLVAMFHVTGPPSYLPRPELRQAVDIADHAGANVILAHGTHALGPVERRPHAVIAWGLGNVAFACDCTDEEDAMLLLVNVQQDKVVSAEVVPIQAGLHGRPARPAPDHEGIFNLSEAIGSSQLQRNSDKAYF